MTERTSQTPLHAGPISEYSPEYSRFVADIGGTHARFALVAESPESGRGALVDIKVFKCADFDGPAETVIAYRNYLGRNLPDRACIAAAGPVDDGTVQFTNLNWTLSAQELQKTLNLKKLEIVNDFTAVAHAITQLSADETRVLHEGVRTGVRKVVVGAGTGLGVAAMTEVEGEPHIIDSEGGHARFAPASRRERELLKVLSRRHDFVSMEMLLAGPGIPLIHQALSQMNGRPYSPMTAEAITSQAREGAQADCEETIELYLHILAAYCTNLAITFCARGGLYLSGNILRSIEPLFSQERFVNRFLNAGAMSDLVAQTPVSLVLVKDPGLYGAAFCRIE
ncbi:MAG: glucokinase [Pseudomonadota bacterium]